MARRRPLPTLPKSPIQGECPSYSPNPANDKDKKGEASTEVILQVASYHAELISALESINEELAITEFERLQPLISDLESNAQKTRERLAELAVNRSRLGSRGQKSSERSSAENVPALSRDSDAAMVWGHILAGKKKVVEEMPRTTEPNQWKDWLEEAKAKEEIKRTEELLVECYASHSRVQRDKEKAELLWSQLDQLYDPIFATLTAEFPQGSVWEQQISLVVANLADLDAQQSRRSRVLKYLQAAEASIAKLNERLMEAIPWFNPTMDHGSSQIQGATSKERKKRCALMLEQATTLLREAQDALFQAQLIQPDVLLLPINIPSHDPKSPLQGSSLIHAQLISASKTSTTSLEELRTRISSQEKSIESLTENASTAKKELRATRAGLRRARKTIFERIISQGSSTSDAPPAYEE